jgi:twinkle protein
MIIDPNKIDYGKYLEQSSFLEAQSIKSAGEFGDEVGELADYGEVKTGATLPWGKTHECTRIDDGKLSIWAGENGSGKSLLLGQVVTHLMSQGRVATIASLEMHPRQTLYRMICQSATCKASREYSLKWLAYFKDKLWIYDQLDSIASDRILGMAHYAAHELGSKDIVIDSLTKCGVGRDYEAQAKFVDRLQWCAKRWNVHVHLVCHMRKAGDANHKNGKNDIRGAAEISDLADNVYILRRNKTKEKQLELQAMSLPYDEELILKPCAILAQEKNRDHSIETEFGLYYDMKSGQYSGMDGRLMPHLEV